MYYKRIFFFLFHFTINSISDLNKGGRLKSSVAEKLEDYFREVLESCFGLDVAGEPVQSRLSLSGLHDDQLIRMAATLGVRRFSACDDNDGMLTGTISFDTYSLKYRDPAVQYIKSLLTYCKL